MTSLSHLDSLLLSPERLHEAGLTDYKIAQSVREGKLLRLRRGVYIWATNFHALKPWEKYPLEILAFSKVSPRAIFSHQSAAALYSLGLIGVPDKIHVYSPASSRGNSRGVLKHALPLDSTSVVTELGLRATSLTTTVKDCAVVVPFRFGVAIADSALHLYPMDPEKLRANLLGYSGRHQTRVRQVAQCMSSLAESPGETLTRLILDELNLDYTEQVEMRVEGQLYRVDFLVKNPQFVVEFDGKTKYLDFQPPNQVLLNERSRERKLQRMGYPVFRLEWQDVVYHPEVVKRQLQNFMLGLKH